MQLGGNLVQVELTKHLNQNKMGDIRKLTKEQLEKEGNAKSNQFKEWNDIFDLLSMVRKYDLSEMDAFSILSNRYKLKERTFKSK